jgi:AcrR family transcriptional regulator
VAKPDTRRDRLRAELAAELKASGRALLAEGGLEAVTLAAIARELGITAPAIYRYFGSRDELVHALAEDIVTELRAELQRAAAPYPDERADRQLLAIVRAFPAWAARNRAEFGLLFGTPPPVSHTVQTDIVRDWVTRLASLIGVPYLRLWQTRPFPVPAEDTLEPRLREQLERYREAVGLPLPLGAVLTFIECWSRVYASTCLEVFTHLGVMMTDVTPMHERMCRTVCELLAIDYEPPAPA